jgi:mannose/fructose/N-acetylgalactosamine-specific phosphotransferase system component IIC
VSREILLALLAWGTLVGLDLVSVPQMMIARPLVAGPIAGAMLGDVWTGLSVGLLFELFQYEVLPVGAARYPEYGPATVAAVSAAHAAGTLGLGLGALVGLISGMAGGVSLHVVRRLNARAVRRATVALEAGDARVLLRLHTAAILRDAMRAALVTALGLGLALLARTYLAGTISVRGMMLLKVAAVGSALAVATAGTLRLVGRGPDLRWFAAGLVSGAAVAWLR